MLARRGDEDVRKVNIIGIGPGNPELLTSAALEAIKRSEILIGDSRMLTPFLSDDKQVFNTIKTIEIIDIISLAAEEKEVGIVVSGDVGFFSLAVTLSGKLTNCEIVRYVGISSLVYFAACLNMSWHDAKIISMHGRNNNLVAAVATSAKVFALTGGANSPASLCQELCKCGLGKTLVYVGENLSYPEEKIVSGTAEEIAKQEFSSLAVLMIINEEAKSVQYIHGLADELFVRAKVPMTKQEVRAISLSKLAPNLTDVIYDIGAGTGSVSIELARLAPLGKVYAFERNPEAIELLHINKERFGVNNLDIIQAEASTVLPNYPAPDSVFIGGSGGNLDLMLDCIYEKNQAAKIVITAITIETLAQTMQYYAKKTEYLTEVVNVFVARNQKVGSYNLMKSQNPIYIINAVRKEGTV